jgi:Beta-L-arabinofuranosidase, GH127
VILVPSTVKTQINGAYVTIACNTSYPSSNILSYTITSMGPFTLAIRIPSWASSNSTFSFDSSPSHGQPLTKDINSIFSTPIHEGVTSLTINLSTSIRVVSKSNNAVAIYYGALLYALSTPYTITSTAPLNWTDRTSLPDTTTNPNSMDHVITPDDPDFWSVAIDPSQLVFHSSGEKGDMWINAAASKIEWAVIGDTPDLPPSAPVVVGDSFVVRLVPYGKAKLHMAELPAISLAKMNGL